MKTETPKIKITASTQRPDETEAKFRERITQTAAQSFDIPRRLLDANPEGQDQEDTSEC